MMRGPTTIEGNELEAIMNGHIALTNDSSGLYEIGFNPHEMLMEGQSIH